MQKIIIFIFFLVAQNLAFSSNNLPDFTKLVEENNASIVNISTTREGNLPKNHPQLENDDLNKFLKDFLVISYQMPLDKEIHSHLAQVLFTHLMGIS